MGILDNLKKIFQNKQDDSYIHGLKKSRVGFGNKLKRLFSGYHGIDEDFLDELLSVLLEADIGIKTADKIIQRFEKAMEEKQSNDQNVLLDTLIEVMHELYLEKPVKDLAFNENGPTVLLMVGVNGAGKTTTSAKLGYNFKQQGKKVLLVAADSFRAGAIEQLQEWASRLDIDIFVSDHKDPSAIMLDACRKAKAEDYDIVIGDTAGRLQNKVNLMNELAKVKKVIGKEIEEEHQIVYLVIDGTTGQNGISQASSFYDHTFVDGLILTKVDGTSKGGIVLAIKDQLDLPVYYLGLGEKYSDLKVFDLDQYLYSICGDLIDD